MTRVGDDEYNSTCTIMELAVCARSRVSDCFRIYCEVRFFSWYGAMTR